MRIFSLKSPLEVPTRLSVVRCKMRRRAFGIAISVLAILAASAANAVRAEESSADNTVDPKIGELIGRIRTEEAKYQDLEVVTRRSHRTLPGGRMPWTAQLDETLDNVRQNGLCHAQLRVVRTLASGDKPTQEIVSAFDGERTRTVEMGNSVNVHLRRYEPSQIVPPHSWALAAWQVNFDLSTFLGGMHALHKDRKVRRIRDQMGTIFEFSKLGFRWQGEETVDGLRCVKILCERWNTPEHGPHAALIWLALDRNLICVKMQASNYGALREPPDIESVVKEWRQIGAGLWLPARIRSEELGGKGVRRVVRAADLALESAKLHPEHPAAFFRDVPMPADLPVFTIDEEGHLADDFLLHLKAVAYPKRRMQEVLDKIRENEAFHASFQATIETDDRAVRPTFDFPSEASWSRKTTVDIVRQSGRFRLSGRLETRSSSARGPSNPTGKGVYSDLSAFDGKWSRFLQVGELGGHLRASLQLGDNFAWSDYAPHLLLFERGVGFRAYGNPRASLADWLTAEGVNTRDNQWNNNQWKNKATYRGSEIRDGLACDVVELVTIFGDRANDMPPCELIWLAKDRNYLPVRWEWRNPRRFPTLPPQYARASALAEAKPGVWFPRQIEHVAFVGTPGEGLVEDRLIINERRVTVVRSFSLTPKRPDSEFRDVVVRARMPVEIIDANGKDLGSIMPEITGVVTLTDEEWARMRGHRGR